MLPDMLTIVCYLVVYVNEGKWRDTAGHRKHAAGDHATSGVAPRKNNLPARHPVAPIRKEQVGPVSGTQGRDVNPVDAGLLQTMPRDTRQVSHPFRRLAGPEKAGGLRVRFHEASPDFIPDLEMPLTDSGADPGAPLCTFLLRMTGLQLMQRVLDRKSVV